MSNITQCIEANAEALAQKLANDVAEKLQSAVDARGEATLVLSGGSTPKPFFVSLSEKSLAWDKIIVTLADERCVEPSDSQSNAKLVADNLLQNNAANARFVSLFDGGEASAEAAAKTAAVLEKLPKFTVVILGMGGDGHTASIFPEATNRDAALSDDQQESALLVDPVTVTPLRITQSANRLTDTETLILHITGESKAALADEIIQNPDSAKWPISHFLSSQPISIYSDCAIRALS